MLDSLFQVAHHVHRLRANPLGALFDRFAEFLVRRGHAEPIGGGGPTGGSRQEGERIVPELARQER